MNWINNWNDFKVNEPFKNPPFNKRNWGTTNHSICSFYGKLKPSISHFLIKTFTQEGSNVLDPFSGSGTIPFEGAMNNRNTFAIDINPISIVLTNAKVKSINVKYVDVIMNDLSDFIDKCILTKEEISRASIFGYNKTLVEYYEPSTFHEILKARRFFKSLNNTSEKYLILACLIHILHGNRPYALSRKSHPITPYAPSGDFEYKSLISKLNNKLNKVVLELNNYKIKEGNVYHSDILLPWNNEIDNIDAIITSPPFFDSTKYYQTNWIRSWFLGWEFEDFDVEKTKFIDTIQKKSMDVYDDILKQSKERLRKDGVVVFHLGKSPKKDMGEVISKYAKPYFNKIELFNEDVSNLEKHGIEDKGSVSVHQYLIMS